MADGQTAHFAWTLPENHVNTNLWGGQNNANWQDADTKVYTNQQNVAAILGQTSTATITNLSVANTASAPAQITFINSTVPAGQQLRWQLFESNTPEATGNVGSDFGLSAYSNTGAFLRTNIFVTRSTGAMSFAGAASFSSTLTCAATMTCKSTVAIVAANTTDNAVNQFFNSAGTRQGYCGWINSGDQIVLSADGGANVVLTSGISLNGNVTGSGTATFTSVTAPTITATNITATNNVTTSSATIAVVTATNVTASNNITATNNIVANNVTANTAMTCDYLNATQGAVVITAGSANANPTVSLKDSGGTTQANFYYSPGTQQVIMNSQTTGAALILDGVLNFTYNGSGNAFKAGGGPWAAPSDTRIKTVTGDYEAGLDEVLQLRPVTYVYKGNETRTARAVGKAFVGLVADEVVPVMPEMVTMSDAVIDGVEVSDLKSLDTTPLLFALVNAVRQLKAEIEALKAK